MKFDTRVAWNMLWVTSPMVTSVDSRVMSSSILAVAMGSSDEQGSSMSRTSGSMARARAMHSRCCCPPDSRTAGECNRSFTRSHRAAWCSADSAASLQQRLVPHPVQPQPGHHVVEDAHRRERVRPLEDHPHPAPDELGLGVAGVDVEVAHHDPAR